MSTIKYILFDAANTLIHKPDLWRSYLNALIEYGYDVSEIELRHKHKLVSELVDFPDITSKDFYNVFNKILLNALGIIDTPELLDCIFNNCKYLPWEVFEDVKYLNDTTELSLGVLSNFNSSLRLLLADKLPEVTFSNIIISEDEGVSKPEIDFFKIATQKIGLKPSEILFIGDSLRLDIIPAMQAGFSAKLIDRENTYPASKYRIDTLKNII